MWALLLSAALAGSATQPAPDEVAAVQETPGGSCVMFTNGVCVCTNYQAEVRDLSCSATAIADETICSYNVIFEDGAGIEGRYVRQRMDVFRQDANGKWSLARPFQKPVDLP